MGVLAVTAYAQYLGTLLLELGIVLPERGDLAGSTTCKVKYVEGEDYDFLSFILAQAHPVTRVGGKAEIRCRLPYFCRHSYTSLVINLVDGKSQGMGVTWKGYQDNCLRASPISS